MAANHMKRRFLWLTTMALTCVTPALAGVTAAELQKIVADAKTLPVDSLRVDLKSTSAVQVVTYRLKTANDDDLKIDTVLVAKEIFAKAPEIKDVSVYFFDKQANQYRTVAVTADRVKAFAAGKLSQPLLLAELTVKIENGPKQPHPEKDSQKDKDSHGENRKDVLFNLVKRMQATPGVDAKKLETLRDQVKSANRTGQKEQFLQPALDRLEQAIIAECRRTGTPFPPELKRFKRH